MSSTPLHDTVLRRDAVRRNQAYALRLLADLTHMSAERRRSIATAVGDPDAYASARAKLDLAIHELPIFDPDVATEVGDFLAAVDLIVRGWNDEPVSTELVRTATRALVLHHHPALEEAFRGLYAPVQGHVAFESLLIG